MAHLRVVVADDNEAFRCALCMLLKKVPGLEIAGIAKDGAEALDLVERLHPHLLITDIHMPNMSGLELIQRLNLRSSRVPVLVMSGYSTPDHRQQVLQAGATAFVEKGDPFDFLETLNEVIPTLVQQAE